MKHKIFHSIIKVLMSFVIFVATIGITIKLNTNTDNKVVDVLPASTHMSALAVKYPIELRCDAVETEPATEIVETTEPTTTKATEIMEIAEVAELTTTEIVETTESATEIVETTEPPTTEAEEMLDSYTSTLYGISHEDSQLLIRLAMAEAGNQDIFGKALVMVVILNRVQDSQFPDTISEVIMQENQFTPVSNGVFYEVEPDDECYEALNWVMLQGWDESQGALYFESCDNADNWHSRNLEYLFTHDGHRFYK